MEYRIAESKHIKLKAQRNITLLIAIIMLISNVLLAIIITCVWYDKTTIVVPIKLTSPISLNNHTVDQSYLRQMALFFVTERLNVTPETVDGGHKLLLGYTSSSSYHHYLSVFQKEASLVKKQKVTSVFYPVSVYPDINTLSVKVIGQLHRWVDAMDLGIKTKKFIVRFDYSNGFLSIRSFEEYRDHQHAKYL